MSVEKEPVLNDCAKALELVRKIRDEGLSKVRSQSYRNVDDIRRLNIGDLGKTDNLLEEEISRRNAAQRAIEKTYVKYTNKIIERCTVINNDSEHFLK